MYLIEPFKKVITSEQQSAVGILSKRFVDNFTPYQQLIEHFTKMGNIFEASTSVCAYNTPVCL